MGGRKRSRVSKAPVPQSEPASGGPPWILIGGLLIVAVAAALVLLPSSSDTPGSPDGELASAASETGDESVANSERPAPPPAGEPTPIPAADAPLPPLPLVSNLVPRSPQDIRDAYIFAAQNPDVLDYVPCYCGCGQTDGHVGNTDCFVESRAPNGAVTEWDVHGMT